MQFFVNSTSDMRPRVGGIGGHGPPDTNDPVDELERAVRRPAMLHGRDDHPLRYVPAQADKGPPPYLLFFSLERVASDTVQELSRRP